MLCESKQFETKNNEDFDGNVIDVIVQYLFYMKV